MRSAVPTPTPLLRTTSVWLNVRRTWCGTDAFPALFHSAMFSGYGWSVNFSRRNKRDPGCSQAMRIPFYGSLSLATEILLSLPKLVYESTLVDPEIPPFKWGDGKFPILEIRPFRDSPFPVPYSSFPIPRSLFLVPYSPFPVLEMLENGSSLETALDSELHLVHFLQFDLRRDVQVTYGVDLNCKSF